MLLKWSIILKNSLSINFDIYYKLIFTPKFKKCWELNNLEQIYCWEKNYKFSKFRGNSRKSQSLGEILEKTEVCVFLRFNTSRFLPRWHIRRTRLHTNFNLLKNYVLG